MEKIRILDNYSGSATLETKKIGNNIVRRSPFQARRIAVKSRCFDACLVIDGSLSFKFNDGTKAIVDLLEEDALRTIQIYCV